VLELALREALSLGHNYIGTEHILLGLVRENEGVAARILLDSGSTPRDVAGALVELLGGDVRTGYAAGFPIDAPGRRETAERRLLGSGNARTHPLVAGWLPFGVAAGFGLLLGWLIWA
jgi:hypothetical protein